MQIKDAPKIEIPTSQEVKTGILTMKAPLRSTKARNNVLKKETRLLGHMLDYSIKTLGLGTESPLLSTMHGKRINILEKLTL